MDRRRMLKVLGGVGALLLAGFMGYRFLRPEYAVGGGVDAEVEVVAEGLEVPWSIALLDDGLLVSERVGRLLMIRGGGKRLVKEFEVAAVGEAGLLGIALHPDRLSRPRLYLYMSYFRNGEIMNRVIAGRFDASRLTLTSIETIIDGIPGAAIHDGGRIRFGPDGMLYITTGDAAQPSLSQDLNSLAGKILRVEDDGSIPSDNPFPGSPIYSYGHRNPQGIDWHRSGALLSSEHGPIGHDEVNLILPGENYGWPLATGTLGGENGRRPLIDFGPVSVAPSGASFLGDHFLIACLRGERLIRLRFDGESVGDVESLFVGEFGRLRDVVPAPDGGVLVATSNRDGRGRPKPGDDKILRIQLP